MSDWTFELIAGPYGGTTEGPAWDGQALLFTHIPANRIMRYDPQTGTCAEFRTGTPSTNGLMFDAQGRLYGCQSGNHCIVRFDPDGTMTPLPNRLQGRRHNRPNDLAIDKFGALNIANTIDGRQDLFGKANALIENHVKIFGR